MATVRIEVVGLDRRCGGERERRGQEEKKVRAAHGFSLDGERLRSESERRGG
jgi:hypothetical protein